MYFINELGLKQIVYEWREAKEENYHQMVLPLLREKNYFNGENIQILIDCIGGKEWVNIKRSRLI